MSWSISIGQIGGTVIRIHVTFLLFLLWIFVAGYMVGGSSVAWSELGFVVLIFLCVLAHEFGHIVTARLFGVSTPDVTLLPIGGVARLERIPEIPYQEFLIAIAGPLVNVVIGLALAALTGAHLDLLHLTADNAETTFVDRLASFNLLVAAFNVIPAFPMDGGRILRAALAAKLGFVRATTLAATIGQWFAFVLGFLGLFFNPMLIFIAVFVYLAASSEAQFAVLRAASHGMPVSAAMMTRLATLSPDDPIDKAVDTLLRTSQSVFPVTDAAEQLVGVLGRNEIIAAIKEKGPAVKVSEAMVRDIPILDHRRGLEEAFQMLQQKPVAAVGVVDGSKRFAGLITTETIGEMLLLATAMPEGRVLSSADRPRCSS